MMPDGRRCLFRLANLGGRATCDNFHVSVAAFAELIVSMFSPLILAARRRRTS